MSSPFFPTVPNGLRQMAASADYTPYRNVGRTGFATASDELHTLHHLLKRIDALEEQVRLTQEAMKHLADAAEQTAHHVIEMTKTAPLARG